MITFGHLSFIPFISLTYDTLPLTFRFCHVIPTLTYCTLIIFFNSLIFYHSPILKDALFHFQASYSPTLNCQFFVRFLPNHYQIPFLALLTTLLAFLIHYLHPKKQTKYEQPLIFPPPNHSQVLCFFFIAHHSLLLNYHFQEQGHQSIFLTFYFQLHYLIVFFIIRITSFLNPQFPFTNNIL